MNTQDPGLPRFKALKKSNLKLYPIANWSKIISSKWDPGHIIYSTDSANIDGKMMDFSNLHW